MFPILDLFQSSGEGVKTPTQLDPLESLDNRCRVESYAYVTTDNQSDTLSWNKVPIWGLRPEFDYC
jgi:hypothetical protein